MYYIFTKRNDLLENSFAVRKDYTYKENVVVPKRHGRWYTIKHLTKALYTYKVNGKTYKLSNVYHAKPGQTPRSIGIKYFKKYPFIAISTEIVSSCDKSRFILGTITGLIIALFSMTILFY